MKLNFDYFQKQKWVLQTVRALKVDEKNGVICLVSMFPSLVMVLKMLKIDQILHFYADVSKNSGQLVQFSLLQLKDLLLLFPKMVWFIGFWATVKVILAGDVEEIT